jgi:hypothetical protein
MKRTPQSRAKDLPSQIFAANPSLLLGAAFEIGMLLGRRSARTAAGRKVRDSVSSVVDHAVRLAPDAVASLAPQLVPAKARPRRRTARK